MATHNNSVERDSRDVRININVDAPLLTVPGATVLDELTNVLWRVLGPLERNLSTQLDTSPHVSTTHISRWAFCQSLTDPSMSSMLRMRVGKAYITEKLYAAYISRSSFSNVSFEKASYRERHLIYFRTRRRAHPVLRSRLAKTNSTARTVSPSDLGVEWC